MSARHPYRWGDPDRALDAAAADDLRRLVAALFPAAELTEQPLPDWRSASPAPPRLRAPAALADIVADDLHSRLLHAAGRSYTDMVRLRSGDVVAPDVVACPRTDTEVGAVLEWCHQAGAAVVPFGGGTSVVGGVNPPPGDRPVVTLQLRAMDRVVEVDALSRAARIQAGATGPDLERQLAPSGLTLRFYPQSFEYSTLGGWIATRAGGHYATRLTHIDDLIESITAVTPTGTWASSRVPASGAGPSPDRMLLGSEGTLGVITEAWVRLQARPEHRAAATIDFPSFTAAATAVQLLAQSGLDPAGCRVLDATEAALFGAGDGSGAVLLLAFESAWRPVTADLDAGVALCRDAAGTPRDTGERSDAAQQWREGFFRAPYLRDALLGMGVLSETFETAVTWDRFEALHAAVSTATQQAVQDACGAGIVMCRITHAYPDGAAVYFTVVAPASRGSEAVQWSQIKAAASAAIADAGGTITHHHAIGRDHRSCYDNQRPEPFARALAAAKRELDPQGLLNPGVLIG